MGLPYSKIGLSTLQCPEGEAVESTSLVNNGASLMIIPKDSDMYEVTTLKVYLRSKKAKSSLP